jgi:hypothetical protein
MNDFEYDDTYLLSCIIAINKFGNWIILAHDKTDNERIVEILNENEKNQCFKIKKEPGVYLGIFQIKERIKNTEFKFKDSIIELKPLLKITKKEIILYQRKLSNCIMTLRYCHED